VDCKGQLLESDGANLIILLGAPRSGTTWIGKIFDSHPGALYRHEPDTVLRAPDLPVLCPPEKMEEYTARGKRYLERLMVSRSLKAAGSLPIFEKNYRSRLGNVLHRSIVLGLKAVGALPWVNASDLSVPDMLSRGAPPPILVFKTVSSRGRAGVFLRAMPNARVIFIVRHPCGQVASTVSGIRKSRFERRVPFDEVLQTAEARQLGLTREVLESLSLIEQAAWHWAILNQKVLNDLSSSPSVLCVRYEDIAMNPLDQVKAMFNFVKLPWNSQSEAFLRKSTSGSGNEGYFDVVRNSLASANRWRKELSPGEQSAIMNVATRVPVGRFYAEG
jgi:hypothetical protein